ncbi:DUF1656 domain-containing protein [Tardiphaga sp. 866_E4_N2_1]|uniref:DUF1656 domain-containing protein n=1 Tax=unclassified Tardiphaga TaxID=2631404 RepID=UPI003F2586AA
MTKTFNEFVVGGVFLAPAVSYIVVTVLIVLMLRPILHRIRFSTYFSNPSIAELSLYIAVFGLVANCF